MSMVVVVLLMIGAFLILQPQPPPRSHTTKPCGILLQNHITLSSLNSFLINNATQYLPSSFSSISPYEIQTTPNFSTTLSDTWLRLSLALQITALLITPAVYNVTYGNIILTEEDIMHRTMEWKSFVAFAPVYPKGAFRGRGIVIVAGGIFLAQGLVTISMLRGYGCSMPIEVWYAGEEEQPSAELMHAFTSKGVSFHNIHDYFATKRYVNKAIAIFASSFEEVLLLDADLIPARDPTYLFDDVFYKSNGAMFWQDFPQEDWQYVNAAVYSTNPIWSILEFPPIDLRSQDSSILLINKHGSWRGLMLMLFLNIQKDFYYKLLWGDKDSFRLSWFATHTPFFMVEHPPGGVGFVENKDKVCITSTTHYDTKDHILGVHHKVDRYLDPAVYNIFLQRAAKRTRPKMGWEYGVPGKDWVRGGVATGKRQSKELDTRTYSCAYFHNFIEKDFKEEVGFDMEHTMWTYYNWLYYQSFPEFPLHTLIPKNKPPPYTEYIPESQ